MFKSSNLTRPYTSICNHFSTFKFSRSFYQYLRGTWQTSGTKYTFIPSEIFAEVSNSLWTHAFQIAEHRLLSFEKYCPFVDNFVANGCPFQFNSLFQLEFTDGQFTWKNKRLNFNKTDKSNSFHTQVRLNCDKGATNFFVKILMMSQAATLLMSQETQALS